MKKYLAGMLAAAAALVVSTTPASAFQSTQIEVIGATVTTAGAKQAAFTLAVRTVAAPNGPNTANEITFPAVDPLVASWTLADRLVVINSTVTDVGGGIKLYTNNTDAGAAPRFIAPVLGDADNPANVAAGLVRNDGGAPTSAPTLPMAWSIKATPATPNAADPTAGGVDSFQWLFVTDASNWAAGTDFDGDGDTNDPGDSTPLALDAPFTQIINNTGIHFGQADNEFGAHPNGQNAYVYFQANFATAEVQQSYATSELTVEAFIQ